MLGYNPYNETLNLAAKEKSTLHEKQVPISYACKTVSVSERNVCVHRKEKCIHMKNEMVILTNREILHFWSLRAWHPMLLPHNTLAFASAKNAETEIMGITAFKMHRIKHSTD